MAKVTINVTAKDIAVYSDPNFKGNPVTECAVARAFKRTKAYNKNETLAVGTMDIRNGEKCVWLNDEIHEKILAMLQSKVVDPFKFIINF